MSRNLSVVPASLRKLEPGFYQELTIMVEGVERCFAVFIPRQFHVDSEGRRHGIFGLESCWSLDQNELPIKNRINDIAGKCGLAVVYPVAQSRFFGYVPHVWNTPKSLVRYQRRSQDDLTVVRALHSLGQGQLGISEWTAVGFSAGANFAHSLAAFGLVNEVAAVSGTWAPNQLPPAKGVKLLMFHGGADPLFPYLGGVHGTLKEHILALLLTRWRTRRKSDPRQQVFHYRKANGGFEQGLPRKQEKEVYERTEWSDGQVVRYYLPNTGHVWNGCRIDLQRDPWYSGVHGKFLPANLFDTSAIIAEEFGWSKFKPERA